MLFEVDHPEYGPLILSHTPLRFVGEDRPTYRPSVSMGSDNDAVLGDLGMTSDEIAALRSKGVV